MNKPYPTEKQERAAFALYGEYFHTWNFLEYEVIMCIGKALGLTDLQRTAVLTHLLWRDKIDILRTLISLMTVETTIKEDKAKEYNKRIIKIAKLAGTRNMAAHNAFIPEADGSLVFYQRKAKGKIEFPKVKWTRKSVDAMVQDLWSEIGFLRHLRDELERLKSNSGLVNALLAAQQNHQTGQPSMLANALALVPPADHEGVENPTTSQESDSPDQGD